MRLALVLVLVALAGCLEGVDDISDLMGECNGDTDCGLGEYCDSGVCKVRPAISCASSDECQEWEQCLEELCMPKPGKCNTDLDCDTWQYCTYENDCKASPGYCNSDADCAQGQRCYGNQHLCGSPIS